MITAIPNIKDGKSEVFVDVKYPIAVKTLLSTVPYIAADVDGIVNESTFVAGTTNVNLTLSLNNTSGTSQAMKGGVIILAIV